MKITTRQEILFDSLLIVHSGEISIKSNRVRRFMVMKLKENLVNALELFNVIIEGSSLPKVEPKSLQFYRGRLIIPYSFPRILGKWIVQVVTGIAYCAPSTIVTTERSSLMEMAVHIAREVIKPGKSFALRVRREGEHSFTSQELAIQLGAEIQRVISPRPAVNLTNPDVEIFLDVRGEKTFFYVEKMSGLGGLPQGSQGQVVVELLPHPNEIIAALALMRRGVQVDPVIWDTGLSMPFMMIETPRVLESNVDTSPLRIEKDFEIEMSLLTRLLVANYISGHHSVTIIKFRKVLEKLAAQSATEEMCAWCLGVRKIVFQQLLQVSKYSRIKSDSEKFSQHGHSELMDLAMGLSFAEGLKITPEMLPLVQKLFDKQYFTLFLPLLALSIDEIGLTPSLAVDVDQITRGCCPFREKFRVVPSDLEKLWSTGMMNKIEQLANDCIIEKKTLTFPLRKTLFDEG